MVEPEDYMMCFKDKTYCCANNCAKRNGCPDYLTKFVIEAAQKANLNISQVSRFECFVEEIAKDRLR
jgi:hypothetical protein